MTQVEPVQSLPDTPPDFRRGYTQVFQAEGRFRSDGFRHELVLRVLKNKPYGLPDLLPVLFIPGGIPLHQDFAGVRQVQARTQTGQS